MAALRHQSALWSDWDASCLCTAGVSDRVCVGKPRQIFARAGPVLYPMLFLLVAYSLAAGNAGTGFRYRTHLVTLAIAAVAILREQAQLARARRRELALSVPARRTSPSPLAAPVQLTQASGGDEPLSAGPSL